MLQNIFLILLFISLLYNIIKIIMYLIIQERTIKNNCTDEQCKFLSDDSLNCNHCLGMIQFKQKNKRCPKTCRYKSIGFDANQSFESQLLCLKWFRILDKVLSILPEISAAVLIVINLYK